MTQNLHEIKYFYALYMFTIICNMWRGGDQGFGPWSWSILRVSRCSMSNYKTSIIPMCNITTPRRGGGSGGLPPEAEEFWQFHVTSWPIQDFSAFKMWTFLHILHLRGSGGLPAEAEECWQFQVISGPILMLAGKIYHLSLREKPRKSRLFIEQW